MKQINRWLISVAINILFVYRAADWKLDTPDWSGRMRITAKGQVAFIKLEDKVSGVTSTIHYSMTARTGRLYVTFPVQTIRGPVLAR